MPRETPELESSLDRLRVTPRRSVRDDLKPSFPARGFSRLSLTGRSTLPPDIPGGSWNQCHQYTSSPALRGRSRVDAQQNLLNGSRNQEIYRHGGPWDLPGAIGQERGQLRHSRSHYGQQISGGHITSRAGRSEQDYASGHHNVVDIERIRRGLDVRTTVSSKKSTSWDLGVGLISIRSCCETFPIRLIR